MTLLWATLGQMGYLFFFLIAGFILQKIRAVPEGSAKVLSRLENYFFIPALILHTFWRDFHVSTLQTAGRLLMTSFLVLLAAVPLSYLFVRFVAKGEDKTGIYTFGLGFSNFGFMGYAIISALFPEYYSWYVIFTLPIWFSMFSWAMPLFLQEKREKRGVKEGLKSLCNPLFAAIFLGMALGLLEIPRPAFLETSLAAASGCMSPLAMVLTGMLLAGVSMKRTFCTPKLYLLSAFKLLILPLLFLGFLRLCPLGDLYAVTSLCSLAMPLGLSAVVIPAAQGRDVADPTSLALLSHVLSVVTVPLLFFLMGV